jgi:hypothetical protein
MRVSSAWMLGITGIGVTLVTSAAEALGLLSRHAWFALLCVGVAMILIGAIVEILHLRGGRTPAKHTAREDLEAQLREVDGVRTWLALREDPDQPLPLAEDRVFQWAKKTHEVIGEAAPAEADAFMGPNHAPLGSPYFAMAYSLRTEQTGRMEYLETRAEIVRSILRSG